MIQVQIVAFNLIKLSVKLFLFRTEGNSETVGGNVASFFVVILGATS